VIQVGNVGVVIFYTGPKPPPSPASNTATANWS
jgi:hypothetical protein